MKQFTKYFYAIIFCALFTLFKIEAKSNEYPTNVTTNVNIDVDNDLLKQGSNFSNLTLYVSNIYRPGTAISGITQNTSFFLQKLSEFPLNKKLMQLNFYDYRYQVGGICFVGLYIFLFYEVIKGNNYLGRNDSWATWKHTVPLNQLLEFSQSDLEQELILEIQQRYMNIKKPTDFVTSLILFMQDIDKEIGLVKYFMKLESWLRTLYIARFFPINTRRFAQAQDHLNRLAYIRNIFLTWAAHYKTDQCKRYVIQL